MSSTLASAAQAAHSIATSILGRAQIQPGATLPTSSDLKENAADESIQLDQSGRNIIVCHRFWLSKVMSIYWIFIDQIGVPGAFTGTCNAQVPGYIKAYDDFKAKGVKNIYVISVNDVFVMKWVIYAMLITHILIVWRAWKERLAPEGTSEY